jgi:hypothetical protein
MFSLVNLESISFGKLKKVLTALIISLKMYGKSSFILQKEIKSTTAVTNSLLLGI